MPRHPLINAYLHTLRGPLPADIIDELTDGLLETYEHHLTNGLDPETAARAALTDFGDASEIIDAFTTTNPARRTARILLATGPIVAACWATGLLTAHAWNWPIPPPARLLFAATLLTTIALLLTTARSQYRTARRTAALAAGSLIALDTTAILAATHMATGPTWALTLASLASLTRICFTARSLPNPLRHTTRSG